MHGIGESVERSIHRRRSLRFSTEAMCVPAARCDRLFSTQRNWREPVNAKEEVIAMMRSSVTCGIRPGSSTLTSWANTLEQAEQQTPPTPIGEACVGESSVQPAAIIRKWPRVYQIVWWWPADWTIGFDRFENSWMSLIYRWSFSVGPLEIRRWENCDRKIADKKLQREARS